MDSQIIIAFIFRQILIVCTTHLDAGGPDTAERAKYPQLRKLVEFVGIFESKVKHCYSESEYRIVGCVAAGDWNVDGGVLAKVSVVILYQLVALEV